MKDKRGFALINTLIAILLLFALGTAAMIVATVGFETQAVETSFLKAKGAADYGLSSSIEYVVNGMGCNFQTTTPQSLTDGSKYEFRMTPTDENKACFIWSQGIFESAKVVKTVIIPLSPADYAALDVRNNPTITLKGSSSISNCDNECPGPGLKYGGILNFTGIVSTQCKNNNKGIVGSPAIISTDTADRIPRYFKADNETQLIQKLNGIFFPNNNLFQSDGSLILSSESVNEECKYTGEAGCTLSGSTITCGTQNINLESCPQVYIASSITSASGTVPNNSTIFVNNSITINGTVNGGNIISNIGIIVTGNTTNANLFSNNTLEINPTTGKKSIEGGFLYSKGNLTLEGQGNLSVGTTDNPVIALTKSNINIGGAGNTIVNGIIFSWGNNVSITGDFTINGAFVVNNDTSFSLTNDIGNAAIMFNYSILKKLAEKYNDKLIKRLNCAQGTTVKPSTLRTKITPQY